MITLKTLELTDSLIGTQETKKTVEQSSNNNPNYKFLSVLLSIPYGLCYGFLTFTLLNFAYTLFLSSIIQMVFFVVIPTWTLLIPSFMTGSVYFIIGQYELNNMLNDLMNHNVDIFKSFIFLLLGALVGIFIGLEFFEFLPFALVVSLTIAFFGGLTHFTVFFNNARSSMGKLTLLFSNTGGENTLEYLLNVISLVAPILAIVNIIFITGLMHPIVLGFFSLGITSVFINKWIAYKDLSLVRRFYSSVDSTIREYAALIIHCIGEGAIPAACATHSSSSSTMFLAQLSGIVATLNEYFTDYHTVAGDKHYFSIYKTDTDNYYFCCVFEKEENTYEKDFSQSFFFECSNKNKIVSTAHDDLNKQFNGVFEYVENIQSEINLLFSSKNVPRINSFKEAIMGLKDFKFSNFYFSSLLFLSSFLSLIVLLSLNSISILPYLLFNGVLFVVYRAIIRRYSKPGNIINTTLACSNDCKCNKQENEDEHSHGLDYKPVLSYCFGLSTRFKTDLSGYFKNNYSIYLSLIIFSILTVSFFMAISLPIGVLHQALLLPFIYSFFVQFINCINWFISADTNQKYHDICRVMTSYLDPVNWLNAMIYSTVCLVAFCIGINGGTEFAHHLSFMFTASPVIMSTIISVFIICALLTEGVWINGRLNKALDDIGIKRHNQPTPSKPFVQTDSTRAAKNTQVIYDFKTYNDISSQKRPVNFL